MLNKLAKFEQNALMATKEIFRYKKHQLQTHFSQEKYNWTWHSISAITLFQYADDTQLYIGTNSSMLTTQIASIESLHSESP